MLGLRPDSPPPTADVGAASRRGWPAMAPPNRELRSRLEEPEINKDYPRGPRPERARPAEDHPQERAASSVAETGDSSSEPLVAASRSADALSVEDRKCSAASRSR